MFNKTLIIVDTNININIKYSNFDLINIGNSFISKNLNFKKIYFEKYVKKFFPSYRKKFAQKINKEFDKIFKNFYIDQNFLEFNNLRNDKNPIFEKIIILAILKNELDFNKYQKILIYYDDFRLKNIYSNLFTKKKLILISSKVNNKIFPNFKSVTLLKFMFKLYVTSLLCKIFTSKKLIKKKKILNISIFPKLFFKSSHDKNNLNFIHTDDTHFSDNYFKTMKKIFQSIQNDMINIEYFVKLRDILRQIKYFFKYNNILTENFKADINYENIKINESLLDYFEISLLNFFKLSTTESAIERANTTLSPKVINYYLFEYHFGFYVKKNFFRLNKKIKFFGFQHGIFNENLMWLDIIKLRKHFKEYLPDLVCCKYKKSRIDYLKYFKNNNIINIFNTNNKEKNVIKISKSSNVYLIILGLHDYKETIKLIINYVLINSSNKKFILKIHPKVDISKIQQKLPNNVKIFNKLDFLTYKQVFISKYSTMAYDFISQKIPFYVLHKNALDYNCPKFLKKKMYKLK
jgi:hypothetical protein